MIQKMEQKEILVRLREAVVSFETQDLEVICQEVIEGNFDIYNCIFDGLIAGMEEVSRLYEVGEYFVPEMMLCTETLFVGLELLRPHLHVQEQEGLLKEKGKVIIGVVSGDIHDIGKNIVQMMFDIAGFKVWDLGRDVPLDLFVKEQKKLHADIVCISSMMTTTATEIKQVIRKLKELSPDVKIMIGGAAVNKTLAHRWGADGYARDASQAVKEAIKIIGYVKE